MFFFFWGGGVLHTYFLSFYFTMVPGANYDEVHSRHVAGAAFLRAHAAGTAGGDMPLTPGFQTTKWDEHQAPQQRKNMEMPPIEMPKATSVPFKMCKVSRLWVEMHIFMGTWRV